MATFLGPGSLHVPQTTPAVEGVAPPGWEKTIRKMKKSGDVDNPWALAWWMKKRGAHPTRKDEDETDASFSPALAAALAQVKRQRLPDICYAAARGEGWAHMVLLDTSRPFYAEGW
jgi:hypothetical protein